MNRKKATPMPRLREYTDQQKRIDDAFTNGGTCCSIYCEACNRTYFITSPGHGDYSEGELESLRERAAENPDQYIEVPDFGSVSWLELFGKQVVVGCLCGSDVRFANWIEDRAEELTKYLAAYWKSETEEAHRRFVTSSEREVEIQRYHAGWRPMKDAPRNATEVELLLDDDQSVVAHFARDLSGEFQQPFEGWFFRHPESNEFRSVWSTPVAWRPILRETEDAGKPATSVTPLRARIHTLDQLQQATLDLIQRLRIQLHRAPHEPGLSDAEFLEEIVGPLETKIHHDQSMAEILTATESE